jgi:acyl-CoA thioester hydrolase
MNGHDPVMSAAGPHRYGIRVYFEDTDAGGIVYHANYLRFAERARTEALRDMGIPHAELVERYNLMFVVRRAKLDYQRPARLDDSLLVLTAPVHVGGASVSLRQEFRRSGEDAPLVVVELQLACVRPGQERPMRIPTRWRDGLLAMGMSGG